MLNIEQLTIGEARSIAALFQSQQSSKAHPWVIGGKYFIRTVTHHYTGKLKSVFDEELVLTDAAWIPDDGRFSDALKSGEFAEVEPFPDGDVIIGRASILEASFVTVTPRSQK